MEQYAYIRVSCREQNPERQIQAMRELRVASPNIFLDRMSGQDFSRPEYQRLLKVLRKGDVVFVKSIDRLGRNYGEILEQWRIITKEIGADIRVIDMPLLDTNSARSGLTDVFIADLVLQILAYVAETERALIKQRQEEGIAAARRRGIAFGCPREKLPDQFEKYYRMWKDGEISVRKAACALRMSNTTFFRRCREWEEGCWGEKGK